MYSIRFKTNVKFFVGGVLLVSENVISPEKYRLPGGAKIMIANQEARRISVIEQTIEGKFNDSEAAQLSGRSIRQIQQLKRKAEAGVATAVLHGNRGKRPHNALPDETRTAVLNLAKDTLKDYNYMHMQEVLEDKHEISISYSALSRLLKYWLDCEFMLERILSSLAFITPLQFEFDQGIR